MQRARLRRGCGRVEHPRAAVQIGDHAAGLAHQKNAGRDVPGRQAALPEAVEAPGRDIGEIERSPRRSGARPRVVAITAASSSRNVSCPPCPGRECRWREALSFRFLRAATRSRLSFRNAPWPFSATYISSVTGLKTTAETSWPSRSSAIEIAKCGMPCRKFVVPSIGSMMKRCVLSGPSTTPPSSSRKQ